MENYKRLFYQYSVLNVFTFTKQASAENCFYRTNYYILISN